MYKKYTENGISIGSVVALFSHLNSIGFVDVVRTNWLTPSPHNFSRKSTPPPLQQRTPLAA